MEFAQLQIIFLNLFNLKILSFIGDHQSEINFIKTKLNKKIKYEFIKKENSPTILKKRFVDEVDSKKLLGVYKLNDDNISQKTTKILTKKLLNEIKKTDITLVVDYGRIYKLRFG